MRITKKLLFVAPLVVIATASDASVVTVNYSFDSASVYNYVTGTYLNQPTSGSGSYTFNTASPSISDYGSTTIVSYLASQATYNAPSTIGNSVPPTTPFSYAFTDVNDYSSGLITEAAWQANAFVSDTTNYSYHIELRASTTSMGNPGNGTGDYALQGQTLVSYLQSFSAKTLPAYFNQSYEAYSFVNGSPVYTAGYSVSSYNVKIDSVMVSPVPEPDTYAMLFVGLGVMGFVARRRMRKSEATT